jgi:phage/plasmid-associated DNA primase
MERHATDRETSRLRGRRVGDRRRRLGILNWLIAGALDFLNSGLVISEDVLKSTAEHFAEMDPCQQFADAHVRPDPEGPGVPSREMYNGYKLWCEANGKSKMFETRFGRTMKNKFTRDDSGRVHVYVGVKLVDLPESPSSHSHHEPTHHTTNTRETGSSDSIMSIVAGMPPMVCCFEGLERVGR